MIDSELPCTESSEFSSAELTHLQPVQPLIRLKALSSNVPKPMGMHVMTQMHCHKCLCTFCTLMTSWDPARSSVTGLEAQEADLPWPCSTFAA